MKLLVAGGAGLISEACETLTWDNNLVCLKDRSLI